MAHIASLNSSVYTTLKYATYTSRPTTADGWLDLADSDGVAVGNVREFPSMGTPANIVNVPVYGQATSSQIQGQADSPSLEFTLNYVPTDHGALEALRKAGTKLVWQVRLAGSETDSYAADPDADEYDDVYFIASIASFEITPSLTDAMQATMTLAIDGEFEGPFSSVSGTYGLPA